jgi:carboxymethylenebutenolidase
LQTLAAYDEDSTLSIDYLLSLKTCNGRIGTTGMCLGGHLAYRCALDPRVSAGVTYFATDLHSATLGLGKKDDSLARAGDIKAELAMIHGVKDNHVPPEGRDLIRKTLREKGVVFSWYEVAWAQRESRLSRRVGEFADRSQMHSLEMSFRKAVMIQLSPRSVLRSFLSSLVEL